MFEAYLHPGMDAVELFHLVYLPVLYLSLTSICRKSNLDKNILQI